MREIEGLSETADFRNLGKLPAIAGARVFPLKGRASVVTKMIIAGLRI